MKAFFEKINQILSGFCGWLMSAMMLLLVFDIVSRSIKKPIQGMAELSVFVMMIVIYLGLARCEQHREHVNLELVVNALAPRAKRTMGMLNHLLAILTVALLLYAVFQNAMAAFQNNESIEGTVELRIWPVKFFMVIGLVFFLVQTVVNFLDAFKRPRGKTQSLPD